MIEWMVEKKRVKTGDGSNEENFKRFKKVQMAFVF